MVSNQELEKGYNAIKKIIHFGNKHEITNLDNIYKKKLWYKKLLI